MKKARQIKGVKNVYIRSGIRYDLASEEYLKELAAHHIYDTLRIAPEHVNKNILKLMNKEQGDFKKFLEGFKKNKKEVSLYFMACHPGSTMKEANELADEMKDLKNAESMQIFTPTPMTCSSCMYYTGLNPKTREKIYVPYTYAEKKQQKRLLLKHLKPNKKYRGL